MSYENIRVTIYKKKLKEWRALQSYVYMPYFNVDDSPETYAAYISIGEWLKQEADSLWLAGVNVYDL